MKIEMISVGLVTFATMGATYMLITHTPIVALCMSLVSIIGLSYLAITDLVLKKF